MGENYFLHERAFDECLDRLVPVARPFSSALVYGPLLPGWADRLRAIGIVEVNSIEQGDDVPPIASDLCLSIGALDTAEELPGLLGALRHLLAPDALLIGAFAGGDSLKVLRSAMLAADQADERPASAHVHPRIDPPSFAALLANEGFVAPVVDVDRVTLRYSSFDGLVRDLRGMATTNRLTARARRPILRRGLAAARALFADEATEGRTSETVDLVHFAAWTPRDHPDWRLINN